ASATEMPVAGSSYTYQQPTGNRLILGRCNLPEARCLDVPLLEEAEWVVVLADGRIQAFVLAGDVVESLDLESQEYRLPGPPALGLIDESIQLMVPLIPTGSPLTHPILLNHPDPAFASLGIDGNLVVWEYGRVTHLLVDALTDSRLMTDEAGRILVLTNPSVRYRHGVLGDVLEATSITIVETFPCPRVAAKISVPSPQVIEGLSPIWADLDADGSPEILVTVSDAAEGARLLAYTETGELRASGPPIGRGYRWRHQLAVAPFGPAGEIEVATVLTPHIGGIVEFYRLVDDRLEVVARVPGYSTHAIGSRNLDMALAGDFDSDGHVELLVPNQQFDTLGAIRRTVDGAQVAWSIPAGGRITTNIGAVQPGDDTIVVAAGHTPKMLRLWVP
ncbi:MAG: hypothetical protein ACYS14_07945, partial [Planctomycetota bacterium]